MTTKTDSEGIVFFRKTQVKLRKTKIRHKHGSYQTNITDASNQLGNLLRSVKHHTTITGFGVLVYLKEFRRFSEMTLSIHDATTDQFSCRRISNSHNKPTVPRNWHFSFLCFVWQFLCLFPPFHLFLERTLVFVGSGVVYLSCGLASSLS